MEKKTRTTSRLARAARRLGLLLPCLSVKLAGKCSESGAFEQLSEELSDEYQPTSSLSELPSLSHVPLAVPAWAPRRRLFRTRLRLGLPLAVTVLLLLAPAMICEKAILVARKVSQDGLQTKIARLNKCVIGIDNIIETT